MEKPDYKIMPSNAILTYCGDNPYRWAEAFQALVLEQSVPIDNWLILRWFDNVINGAIKERGDKMKTDYVALLKQPGIALQKECGNDAHKWAEAFMQVTDGVEITESVMECWFSEVIEYAVILREKDRSAVKNGRV